VALEDSELMVIAKERFDELLAGNPEVARNIRETATKRGLTVDAPAEP
jgi:CRP-like cAMP-binding protein